MLRKQDIPTTSTLALLRQLEEWSLDVTAEDADPIKGTAYFKCNSIRGLMEELETRQAAPALSIKMQAVMRIQNRERLRLRALREEGETLQ